MLRALLFLVLAIAPAMAQAAPFIDAHQKHDPAHNWGGLVSDFYLTPDDPAAVAFAAINSGRLVSIELFLAVRWPVDHPAQPVTLSLWQDGEQRAVSDTAPAEEIYAWGPGRRGYSSHAFVFAPQIELSAGQAYEWRATAPAGGTVLMTDSLPLTGVGNVVYRVWLDNEPLEPLPGDADLSGAVDIGDFGTLKTNFGSLDATWSQGDFTRDGRVEIADFGVLKDNFGRTAAVPEPSSAALTLLGVLGLALLARQSAPSPRSGRGLGAR